MRADGFGLELVEPVLAVPSEEEIALNVAKQRRRAAAGISGPDPIGLKRGEQSLITAALQSCELKEIRSDSAKRVLQSVCEHGLILDSVDCDTVISDLKAKIAWRTSFCLLTLVLGILSLSVFQAGLLVCLLLFLISGLSAIGIAVALFALLRLDVRAIGSTEIDSGLVKVPKIVRELIRPLRERFGRHSYHVLFVEKCKAGLKGVCRSNRPDFSLHLLEVRLGAASTFLAYWEDSRLPRFGRTPEKKA